MAYFPMFIDITDKKCLIVGGGNVALRKAGDLLDFDARVFIVSEHICEELQNLAVISKGKMALSERRFNADDICGCSMVVAATNDNSLNHFISDLCRGKGIPVNSVDEKSDCDFIFPSYVKKESIVAAVSTSGNSPLISRDIKKKIENVITPELVSLSEGMGRARILVKDNVRDKSLRKSVLNEIYSESKEKGEMISDERILEIIENEL